MWIFYLAIGRIDFSHLSPFESSLPLFFFFFLVTFQKSKSTVFFLNTYMLINNILDWIVTATKGYGLLIHRAANNLM